MPIMQGKHPWAVHKRLRGPTPALLADRPRVVAPKGGCRRCDHLAECHILERGGESLLCEIPDELDAMPRESVEQ